MCTNCSCGEVVAFITTCAAFILNGVGVFSKTWWLDLSGDQHGMFTVVNCSNNVCKMAEDNTYGWMVVAQVTSLIQFISLCVSLVIQVVGMFCYKSQGVFLNILVLGTSLLFSLLHIFILVSVYNELMGGYPAATLPDNYVYFQTLPVGLNAVAGTVTIPALVTMLVLFTKERKAKRDAIKDEIRRREREESIRKRSSLREKKVEEGETGEASNA